jgi:arabinogalactan oligomer/maltooligosaccharide transport system substrate-binding protein
MGLSSISREWIFVRQRSMGLFTGRHLTKGFSVAAIAAAGVTGSLVAGSLLAAPAQAAPRAILVWVDPQYKDAATALFANGYKNRAITVTARDMSTITLDLQNIDPNKAPDIVLVDGEQVGELAANALITPVEISPETSRSLSSVAINTFKVGESLFGTPIQRQNLALVTNAELIPTAPTTFNKLSKLALKQVADGRADIAFAVAQGIDGNAYSTYPLFSGLGGFAFGTTATGSYNPTRIGINNKKFVKNQAQIDTWNASGLINSNLTAEEARVAFTSGRAPFWLTSPEEIVNLKKVTFRYRITQVPTIVKGISAAPFMKSIGFAVTTFAKAHNILPASRDIVSNRITTTRAQTTFYEKSPYVGLPANSAAAAATPDRVLLAFGSAALGATPYPNIPEWGQVSLALGGAWRDSTRGGDSIKAAKTFAAARAQAVTALTPAPVAPVAPVIP